MDTIYIIQWSWCFARSPDPRVHGAGCARAPHTLAECRRQPPAALGASAHRSAKCGQELHMHSIDLACQLRRHPFRRPKPS